MAPGINPSHTKALAEAVGTQAAALIDDAKAVAGLNPLVAAGKIKNLALQAADLAGRQSQVIGNLAYEVEYLCGQLDSVKRELASRGLISS